ncbi:MAG: TIGR02647 family protein [Gammaproteobacteria bacterium]|nr:TIGR02647 family protein [Gammaproteobacteria bacterium]
MSFTADTMQELNLLLRYPDSTMEGLKIHHTADEHIILAARNLFEKGLTTQKDGGYLTDLGQTAAHSASSLQQLLLES